MMQVDSYAPIVKNGTQKLLRLSPVLLLAVQNNARESW
jgi:hypothetical protein